MGVVVGEAVGRGEVVGAAVGLADGEADGDGVGVGAGTVAAFEVSPRAPCWSSRASNESTSACKIPFLWRNSSISFKSSLSFEGAELLLSALIK